MSIYKTNTADAKAARMRTESAKKAESNYRKKKVKQIILRFYGDKDKPLYDKAKELGSTGIKDLINKS